jgi:hypothetical protein
MAKTKEQVLKKQKLAADVHVAAGETNSLLNFDPFLPDQPISFTKEFTLTTEREKMDEMLFFRHFMIYLVDDGKSESMKEKAKFITAGYKAFDVPFIFERAQQQMADIIKN